MSKEEIAERVVRAVEEILNELHNGEVSHVHLLSIICSKGHSHNGCHVYFTDGEHDCYGDEQGCDCLHKLIMACKLPDDEYVGVEHG